VKCDILMNSRVVYHTVLVVISKVIYVFAYCIFLFLKV